MSRRSDDEINAEVERLLAILRGDFQDCYVLTKRFSELPQVEGIYALRRREEILYIGRAANVRMRFQGGHKSLSYALIDRYPVEDLRIAVAPLLEGWARELATLEGRLLLAVRPPYNVLYPKREV